LRSPAAEGLFPLPNLLDAGPRISRFLPQPIMNYHFSPSWFRICQAPLVVSSRRALCLSPALSSPFLPRFLSALSSTDPGAVGWVFLCRCQPSLADSPGRRLPHTRYTFLRTTFSRGLVPLSPRTPCQRTLSIKVSLTSRGVVLVSASFPSSAIPLPKSWQDLPPRFPDLVRSSILTLLPLRACTPGISLLPSAVFTV